jgi:hypothetical protein
LSRSERSSLYPVFTSRAAKNPFSDPRHFPWTMGYQPNYQTEASLENSLLRGIQ